MGYGVLVGRMLHRGEARVNSYQTVEQCTIVKGLSKEATVRNPIR